MLHGVTHYRSVRMPLSQPFGQVLSVCNNDAWCLLNRALRKSLDALFWLDAPPVLSLSHAGACHARSVPEELRYPFRAMLAPSPTRPLFQRNMNAKRAPPAFGACWVTLCRGLAHEAGMDPLLEWKTALIAKRAKLSMKKAKLSASYAPPARISLIPERPNAEIASPDNGQ